MREMTQLTVHLHNQPGALAGLCGSLTSMNIVAACSPGPSGDHSPVHLVVEDATSAQTALEAHGDVTAQSVLVFDVSNDSGVIAKIASACGDAGVNITHFYASSGSQGSDTTVVVGVEDVAAASAACGHL